MSKMIGTPTHSENIGQRWLEDARRRMFVDPATSTVFAHEGALDHDMVEQLVRTAEGSSLEAGEGVVTRKRLISVLLETLENVHHHVLDAMRGSSFCLLTRDREGYTFCSGNAVPLATAALLTHRLGILNEMDEADLKEHYLKLLSNDSRGSQGGAGLGLLTMARKSLRPMVSRTSPLGPMSAYFSLELRLERA